MGRAGGGGEVDGGGHRQHVETQQCKRDQWGNKEESRRGNEWGGEVEKEQQELKMHGTPIMNPVTGCAKHQLAQQPPQQQSLHRQLKQHS